MCVALVFESFKVWPWSSYLARQLYEFPFSVFFNVSNSERLRDLL